MNESIYIIFSFTSISNAELKSIAYFQKTVPGKKVFYLELKYSKMHYFKIIYGYMITV